MLSKTLRRADRALSEEDTRKVLARCQWDPLLRGRRRNASFDSDLLRRRGRQSLFSRRQGGDQMGNPAEAPRRDLRRRDRRQGRSGRIHDRLRIRRALGHGRTRLGRSRTPHGILCGAREILRDGRPRKVRRLLPRRKSLRRSLAPSHRMHDGQAPRVSAISESLFR